jgi:Lon protease-like protein
MAVPRLLPGWENDYEGRPPVFATVGVGRVIRHQELPDGRFYIVLEGLSRAEITQETDTSRSFRLAKARLISLPSAQPEVLQTTVHRVRMMVAQLLSQGIGKDAGLKQLLEWDLSADELLDRLAHTSIRDPDARQAYLEAAGLEQRTDMVTSALAEALASSDALEA